VLWYQGVRDASSWSEILSAYSKVFSEFIATVRSDFGQPNLAFYYIQIGRFVNGADPQGWNMVRDARLALLECVPNTAVVSAIDLELDDAIHVGTQGRKWSSQRLERIAERELIRHGWATTPTFHRVIKAPGNRLVVRFKGVNMVSRLNWPLVMGGVGRSLRAGHMGQPVGGPIRTLAVGMSMSLLCAWPS
jgi:hypothetical protein